MSKSKVLKLAFFLMAGLVVAHAVGYKVEKGGAITISAWYEGLTRVPMKEAFVNVFAPGDKAFFQKGRTDRRGRFSFYPDRPGQWYVLINDGRGHGVVVKVRVRELRAGETCSPGLPLYFKFIVGLSIIFGVFGAVSLWKGRGGG